MSAGAPTPAGSQVDAVRAIRRSTRRRAAWWPLGGIAWLSDSSRSHPLSKASGRHRPRTRPSALPTHTLPDVIRQQWEGTEWQSHCRQLLAIKYGVEIQFVPDRDRGDGGLEAYCFDGTGYQCYAPQEAYTATTLTNSQKKKISTDTAKLSRDEAKTRALIGDVQIRRWVLLTPEFDSRTLVEYARKKSKKIRETDPRPFWATADLEIVVATDELFAAEKSSLYGSPVDALHVEIPRASDDEIYAAVGGPLADRLTSKLSVDPGLGSNPHALSAYRASVLGDYVRGKGQMEVLANDYSSLLAAVQRRFESVLTGLPRELPGTPGAGPVVVETIIRRLADGLGSDAPSLMPVFREELARHAVATWLVDCPLYFQASP